MRSSSPFVGTAGWGISSRNAALFPGAGTHLQRYGLRLTAVEINSSFYKPHRQATYARWNASVPDGFRFSVKLPKTITHEQRLVDCQDVLGDFIGAVEGLGEKLGVLLVQLPPNLRFEAPVAELFLRNLRKSSKAAIACEPRHASWFMPDVDELLKELGVGRVGADPAPVPDAALPGGWPGLAYLRWHGAPDIYYSDYAPAALAEIRLLVDRLVGEGRETWCIFDNTAEGYALANAAAVAGITDQD